MNDKIQFMRESRYSVCLLLFLLASLAGNSQAYKTGERAEALINNVWKEVTIIKTVAGKPGIFEVRTDLSRTPVMKWQVSKSSLRVLTKPVSNSPAPEMVLHLGRYDLYSGIPTMYLGHIILLQEGKYKVAFSTDEDNYATGTYVFHAASSVIEWLSGMCLSNGWSGKFSKKGANSYHIDFNKATFADTN